MTAMGMMSVLVLLLGVLLALAKVGRDLLIVRQLRVALEECTPDQRMQVCLQLTYALHGASSNVPGPASPPPDSGPGPAEAGVDP